jgi:acyl-coenzyme A synthetase/AMP-(fatty) acid ligase
MENAEPSTVITDAEHRSWADDLISTGVRLIDIDGLGHQLDSNLPYAIAPEKLAYIHYTSGSTGEPKGVVADQRSELHSIVTKAKALGITPADRISLVRSNNVGATSDALLGLLNGAALYPLELMDEGMAGLGDWLDQQKITVFTCVASIFRHSMGALAADRRLSAIRLVHVGGEPLYRSDVELFRRHFDDRCLLVNRLGISETKTASYFFIDKSTVIAEPVVPVGYPLDGYAIAIVDDNGRPVSLGQVGEIAVKSEYLAQGYWRRPELTEAKFCADPAGGAARIYFSGDLGYLRPDGCLVHVGRKDLQVKVRGHRVDISEVEIALLENAGVRQAAVIAREEGDHNVRLTAFIVAKKGAPLVAHDLRASLRKRLPPYMIPASYVMVKNLPVGASGKIDRRALLSRRPDSNEPAPSLAAPEGTLESVLAQLWCAVLQLPTVGRNDDFVELGGDSLLATRVVAWVNATFQLQRPLKTLFEAATVGQLAAVILGQETCAGAAEKIAASLSPFRQDG